MVTALIFAALTVASMWYPSILTLTLGLYSVEFMCVVVMSVLIVVDNKPSNYTRRVDKTLTKL